jgi:hypothetical protein
MPVKRRVTFEESDENGFDPREDRDDGYNPQSSGLGPPPGMPPDDGGGPDDGTHSPQQHPWDYSDDGARSKIADIILMPDRDKLREFTKIPQGILFDMCLGDVMVEAMDKYGDPKFNAAGYLMKIIDQRLRAHDGWIAKLATVLAGDEARQEDINPMQGPQV